MNSKETSLLNLSGPSGPVSFFRIILDVQKPMLVGAKIILVDLFPFYPPQLLDIKLAKCETLQDSAGRISAYY
jgi:hypothetical protein